MAFMSPYCWLICSVGYLGVAAARDFRSYTELDNFAPSDPDDVTQRRTGMTSLQCGLECHALGWCLSFVHDSLQQECLLLDKYMYANETIEASAATAGYRYWQERCPEESGLVEVPGTPYCLLMLPGVAGEQAAEACSHNASRLIVLDSLGKLDAVRQAMMDRDLDYNAAGSPTVFIVDGVRPVPSNSTNLLTFQFANGGLSPFGSESEVWTPGKPSQRDDQPCLALKSESDRRLSMYNAFCDRSSHVALCERGF